MATGAGSASAAASGAKPGPLLGRAVPLQGKAVPKVNGYSPIAATMSEASRKPLGSKPGLVAVNRNLRITRAAAPATGTTRLAASSAAGAAVSSAAVTAAATPQLNKTGLRALVLGVDSSDWGVDTWKGTLDRVGAAYDVIHTRTTSLSSDLLVRPDGAGRYNAILLTSSGLLYPDGTGNYLSGLTGDEWNLLWAYERDYKVRQATLYNSHGTWPEDYCLRAGSETAVGDTALPAKLTTAGSTPFSYLKAGTSIPIVQSYVYKDVVGTGCAATPLLTNGSNVLAALSPSADGRERISLTFTSNVNLLQSNLLVHGLFRWASRGLFFGEMKHYLNADVDDWFNTSDEVNPTTGAIGEWEMTAHDAYNASTRQSALRTSYPLASQFTMGMAYNGGDAVLPAGSTCSPNGGVAQLTATSKCLKSKFRWINHTMTHPKMNFTDYATSYNEINQNLTLGAQLGFSVDKTVLKTPEYSGLGVYNPDPANDIDPPTDYGLNASNPYLLQAADALGVKYLHGNMSFASHQPSCYNCGVYHPMMPGLFMVPDWPTNIAYYATNQAEETYFYNLFYGPNGKFPFWSTNLTYSQIIGVESDQALLRVAGGSVYTNTFHIGNLRDYGSGKTLLTDWAGAVMAKYSSYYSVPLLSQGWPALAQYAVGRNAHFAELSAGADAVYDRTAKTVTVTSPAAGSVTITGAKTAGYTTYGAEVSAKLTLSVGTPVTFTPTVLP